MTIDDCVIEDAVKSCLKRHLNITAQWIGNPKDNTFGILIKLIWNGEYVTSTIINFLEDKNC